MLHHFLLQTPDSETSFWTELREFLSSENLADLVSWEFWLILTIAFLAGEILTAGFLLGALTPGTVLACVLALFGLDLRIQVLGFVVGTLVGLIYLRPIFLRKVMSPGKPSNVDALVGLSGIISEEVSSDSVGRVKLQNEEWRAVGSGPLPVGTKVRVVSVEGNTLTVAPTS